MGLPASGGRTWQVGAYPHFRRRFAGKQGLASGGNALLPSFFSIVNRDGKTFHVAEVGVRLIEDSMTKDAAYWIEKLKLEAHPEGGYYRQTYRAELILTKDSLPRQFTRARAASTAIYFLLEGDIFSAFHRLRSDELWHFYAGSTLVVHVIDEQGRYSEILLGSDPEAGEAFQAVVKAGCWFASRMRDGKGFALVGCTVAPGFDFADFEMAKREELSRTYPKYREVIERLTRD